MTDPVIPTYPLQWPPSWKRTPYHSRSRAPFHKRTARQIGGGADGPIYHRAKETLAVGDGLARLDGELRRLGATRVVISSNLQVTNAGRPYTKQAKVLEDPGVAVYFRLNQTALVLACDRWLSVAENMAAIAGHIEAIRAQDRYGVGSVEQAFAGYKALPADTARDWRHVFGFKAGTEPSMDEVDRAFKALARGQHPDSGGSHEMMAFLNRARDFARTEIG